MQRGKLIHNYPKLGLCKKNNNNNNNLIKAPNIGEMRSFQKEQEVAIF